jgi:hypothetical protein
VSGSDPLVDLADRTSWLGCPQSRVGSASSLIWFISGTANWHVDHKAFSECAIFIFEADILGNRATDLSSVGLKKSRIPQAKQGGFGIYLYKRARLLFDIPCSVSILQPHSCIWQSQGLREVVSSH